MASVQLMRRENSMQESPRSPEAKLGMQVEDLWDVQESQLSPTEKLNACFESIPVSDFPLAPQGNNFACCYCFLHQIVCMDPLIMHCSFLIMFDCLCCSRILFF